jgi:hypothetical protein
MKRVLPVNAVKASIDWFFSERILKENQKESDKILPSIEVDEEGRTYVHKAIDTRDNDILKKMALILLDKFLKYHPDNTLELFIESHIEKAKRNQSYLPKYKINNIQKDYFFKLERWIKVVKALDIHQTETEQGTPNFTNNFDKITSSEIYKHFKAGLVQKQYLTEQELNEYLKAAFELKKIPETLFKIKDAPNKAAIEAVFYKYYKNVAGKIHGKQNQYAALLGDYFEGYKTSTVSSNFSKSVY